MTANASDKGAIPAGSMPMSQIGKETATPPTEKQSAESKTYAGGRFKSPEDLERGYGELEKKMGDQSGELGQLRASVKGLSDQVSQVTAAAQANANTPATEKAAESLADRLADLQAKVDSGDLSTGEGMTQAAQITAEYTAQVTSRNAAKEMMALRKDLETEKAYSAWIKENPDFEQVQSSGLLEPIKKANPLHDDFSAYLMLKGQTEKAAAFEAGKAETAKLLQGMEVTKTVLNRPGGEAAQISEPPGGKQLSATEVRQGMFGVLQKARGGA